MTGISKGEGELPIETLLHPVSYTHLDVYKRQVPDGVIPEAQVYWAFSPFSLMTFSALMSAQWPVFRFSIVGYFNWQINLVQG